MVKNLLATVPRENYLGTVRDVSLSDHLSDTSATAGHEDYLSRGTQAPSAAGHSSERRAYTLSFTSNNLAACIFDVVVVSSGSMPCIVVQRGVYDRLQYALAWSTSQVGLIC